MVRKARVDAKDCREKALSRAKKQKYILRLFVTGTTPASLAAILNLKKICDEYLGGRYELEVIDIYQHPQAARDEQIIAAPTLIKKLPLPTRKFIGDLADKERILAGLDLVTHDKAKSPGKQRKTAASSPGRREPPKKNPKRARSAKPGEGNRETG